VLVISSITRDNAGNNNTFIKAFNDNYLKLLYQPFTKNIRYIGHIINLIAQDILKDYLASEQTDIQLSLYIRSQAEQDEVDEITTSKLVIKLIN
jgi:hypothetical protein